MPFLCEPFALFQALLFSSNCYSLSTNRVGFVSTRLLRGEASQVICGVGFLLLSRLLLCLLLSELPLEPGFLRLLLYHLALRRYHGLSLFLEEVKLFLVRTRRAGCSQAQDQESASEGEVPAAGADLATTITHRANSLCLFHKFVELFHKFVELFHKFVEFYASKIGETPAL
jgi:hypothetical protein